MKKLIGAAAATLIFVGTANAQGTWYTDFNTWTAQLTSVGGTATYDTLANFASQNGVSASVPGGFYDIGIGALSTDSASATVTLTFAGNAFGGFFTATDNPGAFVAVPMKISVDGSLTNVQNFTSSASGYSFYGYISDNSAPVTVDVSSVGEYVTIDSFTFGNGTNASNPSSAVPEPGEYLSMAILGVGLCGMLVRSRRIKKS